MIKKAIGLFLLTFAFTFTLHSLGLSHFFGVANARSISTSEVIQRQPDSDQIAQFNIPSFPPINVPDIPKEVNKKIDNKVNQIKSKIESRVPNVLYPLISQNFLSLENLRIKDFSDYFGIDLPTFEQKPARITETLRAVVQKTGERYAMIYISYPQNKDDQKEGLQFNIFSPDAQPQTLYTLDFNQEKIRSLSQKFRSKLITSSRNNNKDYMDNSKILYQALIKPLEKYLKDNKITGLIFCLDQDLRSLPWAALYDGKKYLVEKYSLAIVPSFFNISSDYKSMKKMPVLAMGATEFPTMNPLPGAGIEVKAIADLTKGREELNEPFTVDNVVALRRQKNFPIVHFATHADFNSGSPKNSTIYLWNSQLRLDELKRLKLDSPPVDLLVLSACQTALGSREAELGFAGLTIASGAKTAIGSLWSVNDAGTLILMQKFYDYLQKEPTKMAALRKAQLFMLSGNFRVVNGKVRDATGRDTKLEFSPDLEDANLSSLSHPYYWSGFTIVGQPW